VRSSLRLRLPLPSSLAWALLTVPPPLWKPLLHGCPLLPRWLPLLLVPPLLLLRPRRPHILLRLLPVVPLHLTGKCGSRSGRSDGPTGSGGGGRPLPMIHAPRILFLRRLAIPSGSTVLLPLPRCELLRGHLGLLLEETQVLLVPAICF